MWNHCGIDSEWRPLKSVLLHCPGEELNASRDDPDAVQMLAPVDLGRAREEHRAMAEAYRALGVEVHEVEPGQPCPPNQMFCADLFVMTPEGAILARPASTVRAGEERRVACRLAELGIPILKTLTGGATFEGADLMWLDAKTAMIGRGPRTNEAGHRSDHGAARRTRCRNHRRRHALRHHAFHGHAAHRRPRSRHRLATAHAACHGERAARARGCRVAFHPSHDEQESYRGINFVTLGPRRILMVGGLPSIPATGSRISASSVTETPTDELSKAAGNVGCLTGILRRETGA